jgi:hypothetical protein
MDRIILGDNQFFGINHMSEEKALALSEKFKDLRAITDVLDAAYDCGVRAFMLNSNERAREICDYLRANRSRYPDLRLYPSIPYPHKYAHLMAEKGIFETLREVVLADTTIAGVAGMVLKGGASLLERDMFKVMEILIDVEMKIFQGLDVRVVFLQNIVTDLLLGVGAKDFVVGFADYIKKRFGAEPGFITMNLPKLVDSFSEWGIENPIVCSSINKAGYFMNPDVETYERTIREKPFRPVAMSILASGAIPADEAVGYVCGQQNIRSIVFGASSRGHIAETKRLIEEQWGRDGEA